MGLFALSRERRRLARLRKQLHEEPRPFALAELARAYLAIGDADEARGVVESGLKHFPDSLEIQKVQATLLRMSSGDRMHRAKEAVRTKPTPQAFLELADVYRQLGQVEQCITTLMQLGDRFGENATALAQLGELRYRRYLDSLAASDGEAADAFLRRSLALQEDALRPRYLLAEFLLRVGAWAQAKAEAERLLDVSPQHERGAVIRDEAKRHGAADRAPARGLMECLSNVEAAMTLRGPELPWDQEPPSSAPRAADKPTSLADAATEVWRAGRESKAHAAVLVDRHGTKWAAGCEGDAALSEMIQPFAALCERTTRGMEIGAPSRLIVEGEERTCVIGLRGGAAIGLVVKGSAAVERSAALAEDALECVLGS
jgi:tetratricopeptide (TPR) repeat protein